MASPSLETFEGDARAAPALAMSATATAAMTAVPVAAPTMTGASIAASAATPTAVAIRQHPYVRLALNPSFSALWAGQLISLFGDRLNQLALVAVVAISTGSALATGLVFFAATLPNLLLSPIAGTFVDRWDHKEVMVVSDILRAAIVLILPVAAITNIVLVYPLIFLVTSISVFFRPARVAILPRVVPEEDLLSANSALWVGETIADIVGYPLAGLFVALLGSAVPLAFWVDSATYLASAGLIASMVVPKLVRSASDASAPRPGFLAELDAGWQFLRHETVLLANTLQGTVGQFSLGLSIALTPSFVQTAFGGSGFALAGFVWVPRDRDRHRQPHRRVRGRAGRGSVHEGPDGHPRLHAVGRSHPVVRVEQQPRRGDRAGVRPGRREHDLRDPESDPLPGAHAQRADGSRGGVPFRVGLRLDDDRDASRLGPRPDLRTGAGHGGLRARHGRRGPGGAPRSGGARRLVVRDAGRTAARRLRYTGARAKPGSDATARSDTTE